MPITHNDQRDIYDNPFSATKAQTGPDGQRFAERHPDKEFAQAARTLYGNPGQFGMTLSCAKTYVGQLFDATRMKAQIDGHLGDIPGIEAEARALASWAHQNLTQAELMQLVRTMGPHMKGYSEIPDAESLDNAAEAGAKNVIKKHGLIGAHQLRDASQVAIGKLAAVGLRRTLIDNGAQRNADVMEYLASLAYQKGWATKPVRQTLSFEPPRAA